MNLPPEHDRTSVARQVSRRWFLRECGVGLGAVALSRLAAQGAVAAADPLAPKLPPFAPRAKRVIFLFMAGAPSQLELFDYKPLLVKHHGELPPAELLKGYRAAFINPNSKLMGPRFQFAKHGASGTEVSELLPEFAKIVDETTIVKSMTTDAFNHAPAQLLMSTGSMQFGKPSLGSWALYGLGSECDNLPGFVVFSTGQKGPSAGNANWGSGFLPPVYQGAQFRSVGDPVLYLSNPPGVDRRLQRESIDAINALNERQLAVLGDPEIAARIRSYEMAFEMQASAPEVMDLSQEPQHVLEMYGAKSGERSFANCCLLARRMVEQGVRFVEIFHEAWDQHGSLVKDIQKNCLDTDRASAALVADLKQRGLLDDTLVIWGGEFGRTPMVEGGGFDGRDHHPNAFTMWLAGGGVRAGTVHGETDDLGFNVARDPVHLRDLHATILHLLGFDHARLSVKHQGLAQRLTGVEPARVVREILA